MRRVLPLTLSAIPMAALLLALAVPVQAQPRDYGPGSDRVPNLNGVWYNRANDGRCEIVQRRPDGRAMFINEKGDRAWGEVRPDRVFVPDWSDGYDRGLEGRIRGDRIVWPDGNYWYR
jgi:hypothetical protein